MKELEEIRRTLFLTSWKWGASVCQLNFPLVGENDEFPDAKLLSDNESLLWPCQIFTLRSSLQKSPPGLSAEPTSPAAEPPPHSSLSIN